MQPTRPMIYITYNDDDDDKNNNLDNDYDYQCCLPAQQPTRQQRRGDPAGTQLWASTSRDSWMPVTSFTFMFHI